MKLRRYVIALAAFGLAVGAPPAVAGSSDQLPDLAMYRLLDFHIETTPDNRRLLRYTTVIVNIGAGQFQAEGTRASSTEPEMSVVQRIFDNAGGSRVRPTTARMYFAGDGHHHWHLRDLEQSSLDNVDKDDDADSGARARSGAKHGFCFFDYVQFNVALPGVPLDQVYTTCGIDSTVLTQSMGLSVGWGDKYDYDLPDQWVDITGMPPGRYRLTTTADAENWFRETDESNNFTWTELKIKRHGDPRVTAQGPFVEPVPPV
jgi:hypothetical protein